MSQEDRQVFSEDQVDFNVMFFSCPFCENCVSNDSKIVFDHIRAKHPNIEETMLLGRTKDKTTADLIYDAIRRVMKSESRN